MTLHERTRIKDTHTSHPPRPIENLALESDINIMHNQLGRNRQNGYRAKEV